MKKFKIVFSSILICLFGSMFVFFLVKRNVSIEYNLYYITHELKYYLPDGTLKKDYSSGKILNYGVNGLYKNQGKGWLTPNEKGCETNGSENVIYFYINNFVANPEFNIEIDEYTTTSIIVYINNVNTNQYINLSEKKFFQITLDKKYFVSNKVNKISLFNNSSNTFIVKTIGIL